MIQKQFAPAGGASFTPAMPVGHNVAPQTKIDLEPMLKNLGTFIEKARSSAFQQGQIDKLANAYEQGKYWYLGDAYKNGAQYAVAQNDIAQAKVDIQRILNEGLAKGQNSQETFRKVQQRTSKIMQLVDNFQGKFPQAANLLKQQVTAMQNGAVTNYAVGQYAKFMRNLQTGDQLAAINTVTDTFKSLPVTDGRFDPKQTWGALQDQYRVLVGNATQRGSENPQAEAASYMMGAIQAQLAGAQMDDPMAVAITNSIQGIAQEMFNSGALSIQDYTSVVNANLGRIDQARKYIIGNVQAAAFNATGSDSQKKRVAQWLTALVQSGVDAGTVARLDHQYKTALNNLTKTKAITDGVVSGSMADWSDVKKRLQQLAGQDPILYSNLCAQYVAQTGSIQAAQQSANYLVKGLNAMLSQSTQSGLLVDQGLFRQLVQNLLPEGNSILAPAMRRAMDGDFLAFMSANAASIVQQIDSGTFSQARLQERFKNFKANKGGFNPKSNQVMDFPGVSTFGGQWLPWGLNSNLQQVATSLYINNKSVVDAHLARWNIGYTAQGEQVNRLVDLGFIVRTKGDYFIMGNAPVDEYFKNLGQPSQVRQALENLMKNHYTLSGGTKYTTENDQVFAWVDSTNARIVLYREDDMGSGSSVLSYQALKTQLGKVRSQKARLAQNPKVLAAVPADAKLGIYAAIGKELENRSPSSPAPQKPQGSTSTATSAYTSDILSGTQPSMEQILSPFNGQAPSGAQPKYDPIQDFMDAARTPPKKDAEYPKVPKEDDAFSDIAIDTPSTQGSSSLNYKPDYNVHGGSVKHNFESDRKVYGADMPTKSDLQYFSDPLIFGGDAPQSIIDYRLNPQTVSNNAQDNKKIKLNFYGCNLSISQGQINDFILYTQRRMNGTMNTGKSAFRAVTDTKQRQNLKKLGKMLTDFQFFPNNDAFKEAFLMYFPEYRQQKKRAMRLEAMGKFQGKIPSYWQVKDSIMKVLKQTKANNGLGGTNMYYITDTTMQGALGPNLGPKVAQSLVNMQGFVLKPMLTNPSASDKPVVGTGYDYGYPRFNSMVREAQGDPKKMSEAMNKIYLWWFDTVPNDFEKATMMDFMQVRDDSRLEPTFIGATDFLWHSGKGNKTYWKCLECITQGNIDDAYAMLQRSQAYRESGPERKALLFDGLKAYQTYLLNM